jgi:DNA-binding CsgD family transcriptional regulator/uncharacterized small protein (DUF1192 family)
MGALFGRTEERALIDGMLGQARAGTSAMLPVALEIRAEYCGYAGDLEDADMAFDEAEAIKAATGAERGDPNLARVTVLREKEDVVTAEIERMRADPRIGGVPNMAAGLDNRLALLYNGLARYPEALAAAQRSMSRNAAGGSGAVMAELVEAAARCNQPGPAHNVMDALHVRAELGGTDWALGVEAYCQALLASGTTAEGLYQEAVERLGRTRMRLPLARAHLVYGEWLRREKRRGEAREHLRVAHEMLEMMGARSFAGRALAELTATGVTAQSRRNPRLDDLTPQEQRIAMLASEGLPNAEIAGRLYISVGTVEYHLNKVYRKLGIRSRTQLHRTIALASGDG